MFCVGCNKNRKRKKKPSFFGNKTVSELKNMSQGKGSQVKQDFLNYFIKTVTYLVSKCNFRISNNLFILKRLYLKKKSST